MILFLVSYWATIHIKTLKECIARHNKKKTVWYFSGLSQFYFSQAKENQNDFWPISHIDCNIIKTNKSSRCQTPHSYNNTRLQEIVTRPVLASLSYPILCCDDQLLYVCVCQLFPNFMRPFQPTARGTPSVWYCDRDVCVCLLINGSCYNMWFRWNSLKFLRGDFVRLRTYYFLIQELILLLSPSFSWTQIQVRMITIFPLLFCIVFYY